MRIVCSAVLGLIMAACAWGAEQECPWTKMFPNGLEDAEGKAVAVEQLKDKIVGIYFSAHWCPPCRAFTPKLVEFRNKNKEKFEVVFVSSDRSAKDKQTYMTETKMLWPSVPFGSESVMALKQQFGVRGIPMLVILGPDGKTITANGRGDVQGSPDTALETWTKAVAK